jgi:predicted branched-subunit amino acid permease
MKTGNSVRAASLGVGVATGLYGISFGALAVAAGLDIWQTQVLSILMFSGGSQLAFVGVIATGGVASVPAAVVSAWLLGIRNGFYAIHMAPILELKGWRRLVGAQLTIDETTAVSLSRDELAERRQGFWLTGVAVFVFWNLLTLLGAFAGGLIGNPEQYGLDAAAAAAFVGLVWPRIKGLFSSISASLALVVAVVSSVWLPAGLPVILAGLIVIVLANIFYRRGEQ